MSVRDWRRTEIDRRDNRGTVAFSQSGKDKTWHGKPSVMHVCTVCGLGSPTAVCYGCSKKKVSNV